jgi:hypothetical protein
MWSKRLSLRCAAIRRGAKIIFTTGRKNEKDIFQVPISRYVETEHSLELLQSLLAFNKQKSLSHLSISLGVEFLSGVCNLAVHIISGPPSEQVLAV